MAKKTYIVPLYRDDYGYLRIKAKDKKEARMLVEDGNWKDKDYTPKGGSSAVINGEIIEIIN